MPRLFLATVFLVPSLGFAGDPITATQAWVGNLGLESLFLPGTTTPSEARLAYHFSGFPSLSFGPKVYDAYSLGFFGGYSALSAGPSIALDFGLSARSRFTFEVSYLRPLGAACLTEGQATFKWKYTLD
jgi:hypothetical protein